MKVKKYLATVLMMAVCFSAFGTACSSAQKDSEATNSPQEALEADRLIEASEMPEELPEGVEWYDYQEYIEPFNIVANDPETYLVNTVSSSDSIYVLAEKLQYEPFKLFDRVVKYDKNWNMQKDMDITMPEDMHVFGLYCNGDELYFKGFCDSGETFICPFNEDTSEITKDDLILFNNNNGDMAKIGDKIAVLDNSNTDVTIMDAQGKKTLMTVDMSQVLKEDGGIGIHQVGQAGDNAAIIRAYTSCNNEVNVDVFYCIDLETGEITKLADADFMPVGTKQIYYRDGSTLALNDNGIYKIDLANGTNELMLSFNCTNCNRYLLKKATPIALDDDRLIFVYQNLSLESTYGQPDMVFFGLAKADEYKQSGKKVISVASTEPLSYETAEAIYLYNAESSDTYAVFDDRYSVDLDLWEGDGLTPDEKAVKTAEAYSKSYDQLKVDLIAGDGPDIFIGKDLNLSLSDSQYLVDMEDLIEADTDPDFFNNVFEACKVDGGLYQVPLDFYLEGLTANVDKFGGKTGMTFDEYDAFVKDICNGADPSYDHVLGFSRAKIATDLFAKMHDVFIKDGKIDVNNDEFKAILDYCAKLPKESYTIDYDDPAEYEDYMTAVSSLPVYWGKITCYESYATMRDGRGDISLCGMPSSDGRSAVAEAILTCSVTSNAEDVDKCTEFVNTLLSGDVQLLTDPEAIPINKSALREFAKGFNEEQTSAKDMFDFDFQTIDYDDALIADFEEYVSTATTGAVSDKSIDVIIYEEIPAYLEGQKSFEEVAQLINNRATTVFEERK